MSGRWSVRAGLSAVVLLATVWRGAIAQRAQRDDSLPALPPALGVTARTTLVGLMDSARAAGLPVAPLADKAAEGVLKGADDARIVAAVRSLAMELGEARAALGSGASAALLGAAASALHAGIPAADLRGFAHPARGAPPGSDVLESALVTMVDLVAKHVEPSAATTAIRTLLDLHAPAAQFVALRTEVDQAIRAGEAPAAALDTRTRAHVQMLDGAPGAGPPMQ